MRPDIFPRELNELYIGVIVGAVGLLVLGALSMWFYRRSFANRVRPAVNLFNKGHFSDAAKLLNDLTDTYPNHIVIHVLRTMCFAHCEAYSNGLDAVTRVETMLQTPEAATSSYFWAILNRMPQYKGLDYQNAANQWVLETISTLKVLKSYREENYSQALEQTEKLIGNSLATHAKYLAWKAHFLLLLKDVARSGTVLSEAERIVPFDPQVPIIRGHWLLVQGEEKAAVARYRAYPDRNHIVQDLRHLAKVFGITPPTW